MRVKLTPTVTAYVLIFTLLFSTLAFGQNAGKTDKATANTEAGIASFAAYLTEVPASADVSQSYTREAASLTRILSLGDSKNAVLIDNQGYARDMVVNAVANRLSAKGDKRLYRVNWNALFAISKDQAAFDRTLEGILKYATAQKGKMAIYIDDIAAFAGNSPMLGQRVASDLYRALSQGQIQIMSASDAATFDSQITADAKLRSRFESVSFANAADEDQFVGDKLSPDLRELVAGADQNRTVKVILQSDDIDNPQLLDVLRRNNVAITAKADALNMLIVDLPVRAAEEIAAVRGARHISLDRELSQLGHIENTTGVSLVRTLTNTTVVGGVTNTVTSQLDGTGIGIAVVDSGVYEGHRSFYDNSTLLGGDRVVKHVDFTASSTNGNSGTSRDPFGHGSHVAGLIAGGKGQSNELLNYRSMAPNAKLINVRVLGATGTGTTASLIQGLDWILANRSANNIKVVNLSLGTPAIETWRNDPLCRAARRLVDAGIVVVAAAGNNGKNAAGQKMYGAIHSPGNDPSVITVGATNTFGTDARNDDGIATFSSRGPTRSYYTDATGV
ncbi:MAG: S8 family serine peptidase, partial [Pyrinomonadaceae bacterium]